MISDEVTIDTIQQVFKNCHYTLDPHGAVGFAALEKYQQQTKQKGLFLETAHPLKFSDVVEKAIGQKLDIPAQLQNLLTLKKQSVLIMPEYEELKGFLMST